jgi:RNA polymerase sigma-70 factor (ECF subfamily)
VAYQEQDRPDIPLETEALYRAYGRTVERWASRLGGPSSDLEDVVQEVFLKVDRLLPSFRGEAKVTTWLYRITENVAGHARRKQRWRRWLWGGGDDAAGAPANLAALDRARAARGPAEALEARETARLVYRILDDLPEKYRVVLILFEIDGMSGEEIAERTGHKLATVWVHLHRARERFLARMRAVAPGEVRALEELRAATAEEGAR